MLFSLLYRNYIINNYVVLKFIDTVKEKIRGERMAWLTFFIGYSLGMTIAVLIMKGVLEAEEVDESIDLEIQLIKDK